MATYRYIPMKNLFQTKKLFLALIISSPLWGLGGFAQSGTMLPDGFVLPNLATIPHACNAPDKGKTFYNTTTNQMMVCNGVSWVGTTEVWSQEGSNIKYTTGNVGINTNTPLHSLDVNGSGRFNQAIAKGLGIGGAGPATGIEVFNGAIAITSTADAKTWRYQYDAPNNYLSLQENGVNRMIFTNTGNITIGSVLPTARLTVDGTGSFAGNITVNGGNGLVRNTTGTQLKFHTATVSTGAGFSVLAGGCSTATGSLTAGGFTAAPQVSLANLVSGSGDYGKLVTNVQSSTTTQAVVRFCNPTAANITLTNIVFNLICIGQ